MQRFFLSGQTTCAMLLGAGLLLRAQAALTSRPETAPQARLESPRARPAELFGERVPRLPRTTLPARSSGPSLAREVGPVASNPLVEQQHVQNESHLRKGFSRGMGRHKVRKCGGVALAGRQFRCG
jgi:hypothetical protein